jgi:hypothetical protein
VIPRDYITEWRRRAPWVQDFQVEQDLVISRALVDIFSHPLLHEALAFRGGTALYKLHLTPPARYSEDIDLVQTKAEAAGPMMEALRGVLDPWLDKPKWKQTDGRVTFVYLWGPRRSRVLRPPSAYCGRPRRLRAAANAPCVSVNAWFSNSWALLRMVRTRSRPRSAATLTVAGCAAVHWHCSPDCHDRVRTPTRPERLG